MDFEYRHGHVLDMLAAMPAESVQAVITSPPYWGLRSYGTEPQVWGGDPMHDHAWGDEERSDRAGAARTRGFVRARGAFCTCGAWRGELGLEPTPWLYIEHMVEVFRAVWRVLRPDGTLWLNLGDCYATGAGAVGEHPGGGEQGARWKGEVTRHRDQKRRAHGQPATNGRGEPQGCGKNTSVGPILQPNRMPIEGLKPKDLVGIPWRVALALQADGWWLRRDIIWSKPNPMPESTKDRCITAHEYLFHLSKSERYFYDYGAVQEPIAESMRRYPHKMEFSDERPDVSGGRFRSNGRRGQRGGAPLFGEAAQEEEPVTRSSGNLKRTPGQERIPGASHVGRGFPWEGGMRAKRSVWTIATQPFAEAHFATFPQALVEPCILAGTSEKGACSICGAPWWPVYPKKGRFEAQPDVSSIGFWPA